MRYQRQILLIVAVLGGILSVSLPISAEKASSVQRQPEHDAAAVVKLVMVRVLDQDGRPVTDLQREDFILYDNAEKKVITEFEVHTLSGVDRKARSPDRVSSLAEKAKGMNRRLFIFLDIQGSDVIGMVNAKQAALHFVDTQLRPGDEVGILGFSPMKGVFIQEYLTKDHTKIRQAVERMKDIEGNPSRGFVSTPLDDSIGASAQGSGRGGGEGAGEARGATGSERTSEAMRAFSSRLPTVGVPGSSFFHRGDFTPRMADLAQALKYIPGIKSLVLFTGRNLGAAAAKLGREFASASTPVYTVNTKNWIIRRNMTLSVKEKYIWTDHPLQELALASGGKYFADVEDVETISEEVQALTANFYVLGYYITENWDGAYHKIKVEVKKPGLKVLAQDGYFNPKPFAEFTDFERQLHLNNLVFADDPAAQGALDIPVEPLLIEGRKETNCALLARMAVSGKTGVPPARVEVFAFLFDKDHKPVVEKKGEMDFAPFDQKNLFPYFTARLPAGEYECRIVARDMKTGQAAVGKTVFALPEKTEAEISLSSPLLFAAGPESRILRFSETEKRKEEDVSLGDIYKFLPRHHSLVVRDIEPGTESLLAVLPVTVAVGPAPEVELSVRLHLKPEGEAVLLTPEIVDVQETSTGTDILMIKIKLPDIPPGEYELEIDALNEQSLARSSVRKFLVRKE